MCDECGCGRPPSPGGASRLAPPGRGPLRITLARDLRAAQAETARRTRERLAARGAAAVNWVSSPGAGKTTLLVATLETLAARRPVVVIEGDQQTDRDARRIAATGVPVVQINTGAGCHLDAEQVARALEELPVPSNALVIIENVGNLICPAGFDLGQVADLVLLSVTEGEDKPAKYPDAFLGARAMALTKIDLLPYLDFDRERCRADARALNPGLPIFELSARSGEGLGPFLDFLASLAPTSP